MAGEPTKSYSRTPACACSRSVWPAGAKTPMHQHPDAVVIPLGASKVRFTMPDGKSEESDLAVSQQCIRRP